MSGTQVVVVKKALVAALDALPALDGVAVQYAWKPNQTVRERVFCGRAFGQHKPANFKAGRTHRDERISFDLTVLVEKPAGSAEDAETRAVAIGTVIEEWVADHRIQTIPSVKWLVVEGDVELTSMFNDSGHMAELVYTITFAAYLD